MKNLEEIGQQNFEKGNSLIVYKNEQSYLVNKTYKEKLNIRSIAKTILALACGIIIDENSDFNEETLVYPIIKDKLSLENKENEKYLSQLKIKHLLTQTVGYKDVLLMSKDIDPNSYDKLLNKLINYPIYHKPGSYFLYSNASYYLLSATLEEYLGYDLFEFLKNRLFNPLDIENPRADKWGKYLAGATKFYLSASDLLKFGILMLDNGKYNNHEIISPNWIKKMKTPYYKNSQELDNKYLSSDYYGYGLWISEKDIIFASGTGGQLIVLIEKLGIVIVSTNAGQASKSYNIKKDIDTIIQILLGGRQ